MLIKINNLKKTYGSGDSAVQALRGLDLTVDKKDFIAVCGPSGCGKSTLLTIMAGLNHPTEGEVIVDDISLYKELNNDGLATFRSEYIGFVFQSFHLIPYLDSLENVMLPIAHLKYSNKEKHEMAKKVLLRVGLEDKINKLPGELSGGQRQRVAIARALVNNPAIILADEPTGNLDSQTRDDIMSLFDSIRKDGHTIIMVTHDPTNIDYSNKTINIIDGKII